ncbi:hypothetical protein XELAEV_18020222mg [Xenopus laevis]|uniref:Uncharacterized protein n=1 Tax=Xenopus laevis TaxID=8355 RepID=A0A974HQA5_XENLA|nr:hypothetical protein XELAEV_18020222mg [Xenopus laevis]
MGKKEIMPASYSVKTRLGSSRRTTDPNIEVTVERTTKGKVSCSIKGKKRKSYSRSGMESDSDSVELEAGVGVTAGSCGATTEASQEERVESDGCKMAADSEEPRSSVALEVAEIALTNQEKATDNMEPGCSMALEVAESALGDLEMAAASKEHGNRVALDTEQVMTVTPMGKAEVCEGNVPKVSETVIQYDTIIKALEDLRSLEDKQNGLNRDIDKLIDELQSLKGERRNQVLRELTFLDKDLKETETYIKDILNVIEPWKELYGNLQRFKEMQEGKVTAETLLKVAELLNETEGSKTVAECSSATDIAQYNSVGHNTDNHTDNVCAAAVSAGDRRKSWGELAEEEATRIEETPEKRKSLPSVISSRKKSKREEISESQEADWESLEEEGGIESHETGIRIQVKRSGGKSLDKSLNKKHKDGS